MTFTSKTPEKQGYYWLGVNGYPAEPVVVFEACNGTLRVDRLGIEACKPIEHYKSNANFLWSKEISPPSED